VVQLHKLAASAALTLILCAASAAAHVGHDSYVYVGDANNQRVYVYPAGVTNPQPLASFPVPGFPEGMATARNGNLFVTVNRLHESSIRVYSPRGVWFLGTVAPECYQARDVVFDEDGAMFVSCIRRSDGDHGVMEYAHGTMLWRHAPTDQIYGLAVGGEGNLYADLGALGTVIEWPRADAGGYRVVGINGAPYAGGIAFFDGHLVMSGGTDLWVFSRAAVGWPYPLYRSELIDFGSGHATGYLVRGSDGSLYVPIYGNSGGHSAVHQVNVYAPGSALVTYTTITAGLQFPISVAVGPR
jgi:hypothetical protein